MMNEKIAEAIKNGNTKDLAVYRLIKAEFIKNEHAKKPISETEVLQRMVKEREKAIDIYRNTSRQDLLENEQYELSVIKALLPKEPPLEVIHTTIKNALMAMPTKATMKDFPKICSIVNTKYPSAQKSTIVQIYKSLI